MSEAEVVTIRAAVIAWSHSRPGASARVVKFGTRGVLAVVVRGRRSISLEITEPQPESGVFGMLDFAARLIGPRRSFAPDTTGMGEG